MRNTVVLLLALCLIGCKKETEQTNLMLHPTLLAQEANRCKQEDNPAKAEYCHQITDQANEFATILMEQQQDPQQFGQRVMDTEAACVQAEAAVSKGEKISLKPCEEVKVLLAVLSLSSPE